MGTRILELSDLHVDVLPAATGKAFLKLSQDGDWLMAGGWYLAGGTALALQAGLVVSFQFFDAPRMQGMRKLAKLLDFLDETSLHIKGKAQKLFLCGGMEQIISHDVPYARAAFSRMESRRSTSLE